MKERTLKILLIVLSVAILIASVLPVVLNKGSAITVNSLPAILFALCSSVYALFAFLNRKRGNLFLLGRNRLFIAFLRSLNDEKPEADTPGYKKEFALSAFIFCASIPFYIPLAFFAGSFYSALASALLVTVVRLLLTLGAVLVFRIAENRREKTAGEETDENGQGR